jgi:hypothetical protein
MNLSAGTCASTSNSATSKETPESFCPSFDAPRVPGIFLDEYAVLRARARVEPSEHTWDLLDRLAKVYMAPDATFPVPRAPGYIVCYEVERVSGIGPWAT